MPKLVNHVNYRKHLLTQCFDLFAQRGYSALTMRQIAETLNVSTGTLYHYFPTKEALFQRLVEDITQQTVLEAMSQASEDSSFEERLMALFRFLAEHEDDLRKQLLIMLDYYQHRDLYGGNAQEVLCAGANHYDQAIQKYIGLPDYHLCLLLRHQINGLLIVRMIHGTTSSFVEQARPFIKMFVQAMPNTSSVTDIQDSSSSDRE